MCASLERQLSTSAAFMSDKEKDRIHSIAFSFHLFYILKHTILHFSLPLLAEWHPLKQKCCKAMLSPTSFFFFSDIITYTCYDMKKKSVIHWKRVPYVS